MANLCRYKGKPLARRVGQSNAFSSCPAGLSSEPRRQLSLAHLNFFFVAIKNKKTEREVISSFQDSSDFRQARRRLSALWVQAVICAAGVNHLPGTACLGFLLLFLSSCVPLAQTSILNENGETFDSFFVRVSFFVLSPLFYSVGTIFFRRSSCASPLFF